MYGVTAMLCLAGGLFLGSSLSRAGLNSVIDVNHTFPYLINKTTGQLIEPRNYIKYDDLYAPDEDFKRHVTAASQNYYYLKAFDFASYFQTDHWRYTNEYDLRWSAWPDASISHCAKQLDWIESQLNMTRDSLDSSRMPLFVRGQQHLNLMTLIDSFGRPEAGTYLGHPYWLGSYYECLRSSIQLDLYDAETGNQSYARPTDHPERVIRTRYCIGKVRDVEWPTREQDPYVPEISYKVGLCLPRTCETLSYERHRAQLERLMQFHMPEYVRSRFYLSSIYCLPDDSSPIREIKPAGRVFLAIITGWLIVLIAASAVYSCYRRHQRDLKRIIDHQLVHRRQQVENEPRAELTKLPQPSSDPPVENAMTPDGLNYMVNLMSDSKPNVLGHLDLTDLPTHMEQDEQDVTNQSMTSSPDDISSPCSYRSSQSSLSKWLNESPFLIGCLKALSIEETLREFREPPPMLRNTGQRLRINLNALDSIKCLCCILVIFGHVIFIHMQHLSNIRHTIEISNGLGPRVLIAFFNFVDTFFIISGLLTAYFIFKRFDKKKFGRPILWFNISLFRLLRLSPVYILMFWFTKTLVVYISDGPIWDYGTDENSVRGLCINDNWWKSILYLGNWGTMQPLCILPAWSIIVDSQYSLVIPAILYLILRYRKIGYLSLLLMIIISTGSMSYQLATQVAVKASDMGKVHLHVYPLISRFAAEFYNTPWNRIGPVAIGILGGHALHLYEIRKIRKWPWFMRGIPFRFILLMHMFIFIIPSLSWFSDKPAERAKGDPDMTIFIISNATIKPIWSIINTILLLRLVTDLRYSSVMARLMSHNIWHCLGKLCFASYLIHYEIILVLLKSNHQGFVDPNWTNAFREFSLTFMISTTLAYLIHILFEAPVNKLVTHLLVKPGRQKLED